MKKNENQILAELRMLAEMDWNPQQKAYYQQRLSDAKEVHCVSINDILLKKEMAYIRTHYKPQAKECYKNAAMLVPLLSLFRRNVRYVEGIAYCYGLIPIEHAFVKVGDIYIDPTFELALQKDVTKEQYVSLIELDIDTMQTYICETGYYGKLYQYDYFLKFRPELAEWMRAALNPIK